MSETISRNWLEHVSESANHPIQVALISAACSIVLHAMFSYFWHDAPVEPLTKKAPKLIEVAIIKPPPPPPPPEIKPPVKEIKPPVVEPPKPKLKPPVKPPPPKPKPAPTPEVKPLARPEVKAPPKVTQKTRVEQMPDIEDSPNAKITAPVIAAPTPSAKTSTVPAYTPKPAPPAPTKTASQGSSDSEGVSSEAAAISDDKPVYPARARQRHIEGKVTVSFTIDRNGRVRDPRIISSEPDGYFDEVVLNKLEDWKFKPKMVKGVAVEAHATRTLNFKLNDE